MKVFGADSLRLRNCISTSFPIWHFGGDVIGTGVDFSTPTGLLSLKALAESGAHHPIAGA